MSVTQTQPRVPPALALAGAALIGLLTALQARVNGQLGLRLGDGFVAAAISFGSGLVILVVLTLTLRVGRAGWSRLVVGVRERTIPWWMLLGGAAGAFTVATQGLTVAIIGVSMFSVGVVAGQLVCGLVLDRTGYGPAGQVAVTMPRVAGAVLAIAAVGVSLAGGTGSAPAWMLVLPVLVGAGIGWQQATNGRLRLRVGTPLTATLVNFIGGTVLLVVAASVHVAFVGAPGALPTDAWLYSGGAIGVTYIFLSAALVSTLGVLLLGLGIVVGQLVTSTILDALWPATASPGLALELVTVTLAVIAVVVASLRIPRIRASRRERR